MNLKQDEFNYIFDKRNNLTEIKENNLTIIKYYYNKSSKLVREDNKILNKTFILKYSKQGNLLERTTFAFSSNKALKEKIYMQRYYEINNKLVLHNDEQFYYDKLGFPIKYRNASFKWSLNQLLKIDDIVEYEYFSNKRICKKFDNVIVEFSWLGNNLIGQYDGKAIEFNYKDNVLIGFSLKLSNSNNIAFKYKKNISGDIIGIYDSQNILFCKYYYDAWGNCVCFVLNVNGEFEEIGTSSNKRNLFYEFVAQQNPFRFKGFYFDVETGLYYTLGRYYDPELGKFIK